MLNDNPIIAQRFAELPETIRGALTNPVLKESVRIIAQKNQLPVEKLRGLEDEVALVLLAFEEPADLEKNITRELLLTPAVAASIARDVSAIIIAPIRADLDRLYKEQSDAEKEVAAQTPPAPTEMVTPAPPIPAATPAESHQPSPDTSVEDRPFYARVPNYADAPAHQNKDVPPPVRNSVDPYREPTE